MGPGRKGKAETISEYSLGTLNLQSEMRMWTKIRTISLPIGILINSKMI